MASLEDLQKLLENAAKTIPDKALTIIAVEGKNFVKKNFRDEGFTDRSLKKWEKRKTTDREGRDITRYRTDRTGSKGSLNKYGRQNKDRAILTGHATGGDKLRNSVKSKVNKSSKEVSFYTYKEYAEIHNEGSDDIPQRQFIGPSEYLNSKIEDKLKKEIDKTFNQ